MKVSGIVAEYNPFHNGHKYHIEETRRITGCDAVAAVMSGSFVQRGEPSVFDKWSRAAAAIEGGVDLVLELPVYYSLKSAEGFAFGAVSILNALGAVNFLSFGAENADTDILSACAKVLLDEPPAFKDALQGKLKKGHSYAAACTAALTSQVPAAADILGTPNNTLAIEYIRSLLKLNSSIKPIAVKRSDNGYNSSVPKDEFLSATAIRDMVFKGMDVSGFCPLLPQSTPVSIADFDSVLRYFTISASQSDIGSDGVLNRILGADTTSLNRLLESVKTKQIPMSRVKRTLFNMLLCNHLKDNLMPSYIRVLAMNKKGAALIKNIKSKATLPIITKPALYKQDDPIWALENRATDIYFLPSTGERGKNLTTSPVIID